METLLSLLLMHDALYLNRFNGLSISRWSNVPVWHNCAAYEPDMYG